MKINQFNSGDSSTGGDRCLWTNVMFSGYIHTIPENTIFYDDMSDIASSGWTATNAGSVSQSTSFCSLGSCVEIKGYDGVDNSIYISIPVAIDEYFKLLLCFDVYLYDMEDENACQLFYKFNTDADWLLLRAMSGKNGDGLQRQNMITLLDHPQLNAGATTLEIKLATFGDSSDGGDLCYFDEFYVKGTKLDTTNTATMQQQVQDIIDARDAVENIIIVSDIGGQQNAPYVTPEQLITADMMNTIAKSYDVHGFICLGDNIYNNGVRDEFDPRFQVTFEDVYVHEHINDINWWFTTGNHDYYDNITGEIEYTKHSQTWNFPDLYYTKTWFFGDNNEIEVLFVALDTWFLCGNSNGCMPSAEEEQNAEEHWQWLRDTLAASTATFKLVGGHHPIYSYAHHGPLGLLIDNLNPMLEQYGVNAFIFGHDHQVQFIEDNVTTSAPHTLHHIGSGAGHGCRESLKSFNSELNPSDDALKYMDCDLGGFVRLQIDTKKVEMQAFYYLSSSSNVQFFSGIWDKDGNYKTVNEIIYGPGMEPTPIPTTDPTSDPSLPIPSVSPTLMPSKSPTNPTLFPTNDPTKEPTAFLPETEQIWFDPMVDFTANWVETGGVTQISDDDSSCISSTDCVQISGTVDQDDWIIRQTSLSSINNLDSYTGFLLKYDVMLDNMETDNNCVISYKYDGVTDYTVSRRHLGDSGDRDQEAYDQTAFIPINDAASTLFIKLETDGDSDESTDFCLWTNIYLLGYTHVLSDDTLFYDDMSDISSSGWSITNAASVKEEPTGYCSIGGCVQIIGFDGIDNSIYRSIPIAIDEYSDIFIEFDVYFRDMESSNACETFYKYDIDADWTLLQSLPGGNGKILQRQNTVSVPNPTETAATLEIKLATNGDSSRGGDFCYFDEFHVKGTKKTTANPSSDPTKEPTLSPSDATSNPTSDPTSIPSS